MRISITFQSYFNCIKRKEDWCSSFGGSIIYLILLLLTIYLYNKYTHFGYKGKNKYLNDNTLTWWRHDVYKTPV